MEEGHVVYRYQRKPDEELRFTLREYKERSYLDIRFWFLPSSGGEYAPTRRGLTLSVDLVKELKKGVDSAEKTLKEFALQSPSKSVE